MTDLSKSQQRDLLSLAQRAADAARAVILPYFRSARLDAENKSDAGFDPVTRADREAEQAIRDLLRQHRPGDGILGEEFGHTAGTSGLTWVLDPIDGTRGFICGTPTWGTLIALRDANGPLMGLIDQPHIGERFIGGFGVAEFLHGEVKKPLKVRPAPELGAASLFTTFPGIGSPAESRAFETLSKQVRLTRYGMDCYAYGLLALGCVDLVVEAGLGPHDIQAPIAVIEAAGGMVTNWQGGPAHDGGQVIAAASPHLHEQALEFLNK